MPHNFSFRAVVSICLVISCFGQPEHHRKDTGSYFSMECKVCQYTVERCREKPGISEQLVLLEVINWCHQFGVYMKSCLDLAHEDVPQIYAKYKQGADYKHICTGHYCDNNSSEQIDESD